MNFEVRFSNPFKRSVRRLRRKYRRIQADLEAAIEVLLLHPDLGTVIPGTPGIRKLRVASSDIGHGKRGGFRLLYRVVPDRSLIVLLFVYAKPERKDLSRKEIERIVEEALEENMEDREEK